MSMLGKNDFPIKKVEKGAIIIREGEAVENLLVIQSGEVVCVVLSNNRIVPVGNFKGSGVLGEDAVFSDSNKSSYSVVAMTNASYIEIPREEIHKIIEGSSSWIKRILFDMSDKISKTTQILSDHRIIDEKFNNGQPLSTEDESLIHKALKD